MQIWGLPPYTAVHSGNCEWANIGSQSILNADARTEGFCPISLFSFRGGDGGRVGSCMHAITSSWSGERIGAASLWRQILQINNFWRAIIFGEFGELRIFVHSFAAGKLSP